MRKILIIFAAASVFAACNTQSDLETKKDVVVTDTSAMYKSNGSTDTATTVVTPPAAPAPVTNTRIIHDTRTVYVDRTPRAPRQTVRQAAPTRTTTTTTQTTSGTGTNTQSSGTGTTSTTTTPAPAPEKKGWSNAAKDAAIGGAAGAIGGAIISKKKGKGAIIGGAAGAVGGYILGRKKDRADTTR